MMPKYFYGGNERDLLDLYNQEILKVLEEMNQLYESWLLVGDYYLGKNKQILKPHIDATDFLLISVTNMLNQIRSFMENAEVSVLQNAWNQVKLDFLLMKEQIISLRDVVESFIPE
jgi:hypothetical protein